MWYRNLKYHRVPCCCHSAACEWLMSRCWTVETIIVLFSPSYSPLLQIHLSIHPFLWECEGLHCLSYYFIFSSLRQVTVKSQKKVTVLMYVKLKSIKVWDVALKMFLLHEEETVLQFKIGFMTVFGYSEACLIIFTCAISHSDNYLFQNVEKFHRNV